MIIDGFGKCNILEIDLQVWKGQVTMNLKLVLVVSLFFVLFGCSEPEQSKADPVTFSVLYNDVARRVDTLT
jgi:hypothetical protein